MSGFIKDFMYRLGIFEKKSEMENWAEREVRLACASSRAENATPDNEWDYNCACCESALGAYDILMGQGHSGSSMGMTKHILNRLIDGKPLTPIVDTPDIWNNITNIIDGRKREADIYQCRRMGSLFKYVYADGTVKYQDIDSHYCIDIRNRNTYQSKIVADVMDELFPIVFPYIPNGQVKVYCENILTDEKNGDFDTMAVFYALLPNGDKGDRVEINQFFKAPSNSGDGWIKITEEEYRSREKLVAEREGMIVQHNGANNTILDSRELHGL